MGIKSRNLFRTINQFDVKTRAITTVATDLPRGSEDLTWLPDGKRLIMAQGNALRLWTEGSGWSDLADLTASGVTKITRLAASPDGKWLYFLSDRVEAGIVLSGTEVKSARDGKIQLNDAFGEVSDGEAWLMNAHIGQYSHGNIMNHEPMRRRKLLLHKAEIKRMLETTRERGLTIIPTKLYLKNGLVKVELAGMLVKVVPPSVLFCH